MFADLSPEKPVKKENTYKHILETLNLGRGSLPEAPFDKLRVSPLSLSKDEDAESPA
jgi:hypothetical protein